MHIYIEFLLHIPNQNLNHFFHIEFLSFCLHIKGLYDICTAIFPQSSARAVLSCARLCSQASINPSSCFPAAKIPHILLYKEAFCLPFVSSDHPIIPSPHILGTGQQLLKHLFSAGYPVLYFLIILISEIEEFLAVSWGRYKIKFCQ